MSTSQPEESQPPRLQEQIIKDAGLELALDDSACIQIFAKPAISLHRTQFAALI